MVICTKTYKTTCNARIGIASGLKHAGTTRSHGDAMVDAIKEELEREGPQWIWKDGKGGYEAFLKTLDSQEREPCAVLTHAANY